MGKILVIDITIPTNELRAVLGWLPEEAPDL
jgi:hypothetical protein